MGNPVVQWQIITKEPDKHAAFYSKVFGWTIRTDNPLGYRVAEAGSPEGIGGGFWPVPPEATAFVQLFIQVENITEAVAKATQNGGAVLIPPQVLPGGEEMAVLRDSMGISFGIMRQARRG